jgi:hypothetical protein
MSKKGFTPEQIIKKLWEAEVLISKGESVGTVVRKLGGDGCNILPMAERIRRDAGRALTLS